MSLSPRDSWQEAWQSAIDLSVGELQKADLEERCARSGALWKPEEETIEIDFLNRSYLVRLPTFEVVFAEEAPPIRERILLLHYLQKASGTKLSGEWIAFTQVPGGELYLGNFRARSVDRLVRAFGGREEKLAEVAGTVGGDTAEYGDVSLQLRGLPQVPVMLVLWRGDEEFPPSGNILFDATVTEYLPTEDMVVLAEMAVGLLLDSTERRIS